MSNSAADRGTLRIAVIGAGASGLLALIKLREAGFGELVCFEKADDLGGTWRDNRYPGLTCDVPSLAYRYSFAPNPEWSRVCAPGPEILAYLHGVADGHGIKPLIRFGQEVTCAEWSEGGWEIETSQGPQGRFDVVLTATGVLHHPVIPDLPGLESFRGRWFHSSRWDDGAALEGKRVGVVGTGSTAIQIVSAIVGEVERLSMFQRTAQWIVPLENPEIDEAQKALYRSDPALLDAEYRRLNDDQGIKFAAAIVGENPAVYAKMEQVCREHLEAKVADPELRLKLTPDHKVGCKRLIMAGGFYEAIQRPNAELVTEAIAGIEPKGVRTADGRLHELDVLVLATGFDTHRFFRPMQVAGVGGVTLEQAWAEKNEGYLAVTAPGFPNWFMIGGPNSPIGNFSWLMTAEHQLAYCMQLIELVAERRARAVAPTPAATAAFNAALEAKLPGTIWASGGCRSWYLDKAGRVASWPWSWEKFQADMSRPVLEDFELL